MIRPIYITLTRQDIKKIVKEISNPDLANIVGKWKPYLKPVRKRRPKENTIFLAMINLNGDNTISLSEEQYYELTEWRNYCEARKVRNWKSLAKVQWSSLSGKKEEELKTEIRDKLTSKVEFLKNLPNPDYYNLSIKLIAGEKELWITLEFVNSPRPVEEWSTNEQRIIWREILQISRIRAKVTKSSRQLKLSGRKGNLKLIFENILIDYFTDLNPRGLEESKNVTTEDISRYLQDIESERIKDEIMELTLDTNLPGIETIIIEVKDFSSAKVSLRERYNIDLDVTVPIRIESYRAILEKDKKPVVKERKATD